ncbi:MAG: enolase C-terminal domain-like protein [Sneathiellaceae bacterium]
MRIADMTWRHYRIAMKDPDWQTAGGRFPAIPGLFVFLHGEDGAVGRGTAIAQERHGLGADVVAAYLAELKPRLVGQEAAAITARMLDLERLVQVPNVVRASVDCALHELNAVSRNVPLWSLLGGPVHRSIPQARMVPVKTPAEMAAIARGFVAEGYRFLKVKAIGDAAVDIGRIAGVRDAVGRDIRLMIDANGGFALKDALAILPALQELGVEIFEQPVAAGDLDGMRRLRDAGRILIEADEAAASIPVLRQILAMSAADLVSLKLPKLGGMRGTLQAACLCDAAGIGYRLGTSFGSGLLQAQSLVLAGCLPNLVWASEHAVFADYADDPCSGLTVTGGAMSVPDAPDCGVVLSD